MARFELVELLDRHHVDGPQPIDLGSQPGDRLLGAQRTLGRCHDGGVDVDRIGRILVAGFAVGLARLDLVVRADDARVRRCPALALELFHFRNDVVDRRLNALDACGSEMREPAFGCRSRDVEFSNRAANGLKPGAAGGAEIKVSRQ